MSGSSTTPKFEIAQGFSVTVPGPLDDRTIISSIDNLTSELPMGIRYIGMPLIWVEDVQRYYIFSGGVANENFISFADFLQFGDGEIVSIAFTYDNPILAGSSTILTHNLNSTNLHVTIYDGLQPLLIDWYIQSGINSANQIVIDNQVDVNNMRVVIAYAQMLSNNPSQFTPDESILLKAFKKQNIVADTTQSILANTKIVSIDYRYISGTPVIKCGLSDNVDDIHPEITIESTEDSNVLINRTFTEAKILYFTVSGGSVSINVNINENVF